MIIVDTREQKPIWDPDEPGVLKLKLDEGDYTTTELKEKAHIERKSGNDLYGSIIQGHVRFREELKRAKEKGITLAVFVECEKEQFIGKKFKGGFRLKSKPAALRKIVSTMEEKYDTEFVWCDGREKLKEKALQWFDRQISLNGGHKAEFVNHDVAGRNIPEQRERRVTWST